MTGDYLWDGSGTPDPEIERLEELLAPLAYDEPLDELRLRRAGRLRRLMPFLAAAAVVVIGAGALLAWQWGRGSKSKAGSACAESPTAGATWAVVSLRGTPRCGGRAMAANARLPIGTWLETDIDSRARVAVADIGTVDLEESSRLRVLASAPDEHRLQLARGAIHARISAPPRIFLVETPSAVAVDLGCEYTLQVDENGRGLLHVTSGFVSLERDGRDSFVPAGAKCETRPGVGPGTPFAQDASADLRAALAEFDFDGGGDSAIGRILELAGEGDTVSLWNLLIRSTGERRVRIYERLAALVPPPGPATRERILRGDPDALTWWRMTLEDTWFGDEFWEEPAEDAGTEPR